MRTIKFRYWDMVRKQFITDGDVYFVAEDAVFAGDLGNPPVVDITGQVQISQFTGLHDKNGKEIYESDIVKIPCDIPDSIHGNYSFHEVVYRNGTWINQYLKSETGFKLPRGYTAGVLIDNYEHQMKNLVFNDGYLTDTEIEVIGNIFENKDLLS